MSEKPKELPCPCCELDRAECATSGFTDLWSDCDGNGNHQVRKRVKLSIGGGVIHVTWGDSPSGFGDDIVKRTVAIFLEENGMMSVCAHSHLPAPEKWTEHWDNVVPLLDPPPESTPETEAPND